MDLHAFLPEQLPSNAAQRLFHGRGRMFEGLEQLSLDWYAPALLLTQFDSVEQSVRDDLIIQIHQWWTALSSEPCTLVWQDRSVSPAVTELVMGSLPEPHWVEEDGLEYRVDLLNGQNHGFFLDMANGRDWVRQNSQRKRVLNLFAYTCAFSVAARAGGAIEVTNLDMSESVLSQGKRNHERNGLADGVRYLSHDLFKTFGRLRKRGPYDIIIVDPPSYQPGSFAAAKDYGKVIRRLPKMMAPDAEVLLCLNAPELGPDYLQDLVKQHAPDLKFIERLPNPEAFVDVDDNRSLKVMRFISNPEP